MSSLRLALKLSMEASAPAAPPPEAKPKRKRSSSEVKSAAGNAESSDESDAGEAVVARKRSSSQVKENKEKDQEGGGATKKRSSSSAGVGDSKAEGGDRPKATSSKKKSKSKAAPKQPKSSAELNHDADDEADSVVEMEDGSGSGTGAAAITTSTGAAASTTESKPKASKRKEPAAAATASTSSTAAAAAASEDGGEGGAAPKEAVAAVSTKKRKPKAPVGDDEDREGGGDGGDGQVSTPRYQSHRAAAMVAKVKLNSRGPKPPPEEEHFASAVTGSALKSKFAAEQAALQWVACDRCGKWRSLPSHTEMGTLPEQWYCSMNKDERFNDCSIEEEVIDEHSDIENEMTDDYEGGGNGSSDEERGGRGGPRGAGRNGGPADKVNWVQCNSCSKWRKVPGSIDVDSLPEVWQCSMNTWAPAFSRCTAKEETEDTDQENMMRGRRPPLPGGGYGQYSSDANVKKVIQWVQCERRSCKKWRKLPGHVDMSLLPEKWYCEMNEWDLERASCECPEDSDSEGEQNLAILDARAAQQQAFLLANPKATGTSLSYRRIIFGTDGRIRPTYSEKNKNGFGLFSFTMPKKGDEDERDEDDDEEGDLVGPVEPPTRRISYWWSSAYDESGSLFLTSQSQQPMSTTTGSANSSSSSSSSGAGVGSGSSGTAASSSSSGKVSSSSVAPPADADEADSIAVHVADLVKDRPAHHLLRCAQKLGGSASAPYNAVFPLRSLKAAEFEETQTMLELERAECTVIRSCLQASGSGPLTTFPALMQTIRSSFFLVKETESCRSRMTVESVKAALQRLEARGEVDVSFKSNGEMCAQLSLLPPAQPEHVTLEPWKKPSAPLKLQKIIVKDKKRTRQEEVAAAAEKAEKAKAEKATAAAAAATAATTAATAAATATAAAAAAAAATAAAATTAAAAAAAAAAGPPPAPALAPAPTDL